MLLKIRQGKNTITRIPYLQLSNCILPEAAAASSLCTLRNLPCSSESRKLIISFPAHLSEARGASSVGSELKNELNHLRTLRGLFSFC